MSQPLAVITDHDFEDLSAEREVLSPRAIALRAFQCKTEGEILEVAKEADALLVQYAPITESVLSRLERCRVIARYGVGVDSIDLAAATRHGVVVCNVRSYCATEVADQAMSLLLALARRTALMNEQVKSGIWDVYRDGLPIRRLGEQVLGIVGFGNIGRTVATRARAFGLKVLAYDPLLDPEAASALGASPVTLEELLRRSDFVSIHAPLAAETRHLIDAPQLALMKPSACLINTSRGGLVCEAALVKALKEGRIAGAGLDVLEKEPPDPANPLLQMKNVILTPHASFYSQESLRELHVKAATAVATVLVGKVPEDVVNTDVLARLQLQRCDSDR